jgi:hypothetical protein
MRADDVAGNVCTALGAGHYGVHCVDRSGAVHVDPIKPSLKAPGTNRLKLEFEVLLLNFGSKFSLRRHTAVGRGELGRLMAFKDVDDQDARL